MDSRLNLTCTNPPAGACLVDCGRPFHRALGVARGGPADPVAARAANLLLGQAPDNCCIEAPLYGGQWLLNGGGQIALTGADMCWRLNGNPVDRYSVLYLDGDYLLSGRAAVEGCRAYLAVRGQWAVPTRLGSAEAGLPGTQRLQKGSRLTVIAQSETPFRNDLPPRYASDQQEVTLPARPGPEWHWLPPPEQQQFLAEPLRIGRSGDRQGLRLDTKWSVPSLASMISSPVLPGTVQLAPGGPILLGPDAQTVGGYPRILLIEDYYPVYQLRPGQGLRLVLHRL